MTTIAERVAAGAAFLDEHDPDWWRADVERAIDLDRLDLEDGEACVLGQRCPLELAAHGEPYLHFGRHLSGVSGGYRVDAWAVPYGFQADPRSDRFLDDYATLTAEWKRVITERRAAS